MPRIAESCGRSARVFFSTTAGLTITPLVLGRADRVIE